ncbi:TPA: plasmid segregation protein ParM domain-containing protein [Photobacterium damselae]
MDTNNYKIVVGDDGSTACKLAYFDESNPSEVKTFVSHNRAELGQGFSFGKPNYVYITDDEKDTKYTFSDDKNALPTSNKAFQYDEQCRASVQHALVQSGIQETNIDLCVTLPISQFFNKDGTHNTDNIERKRAVHLGYIKSVNHKTYNIKSVSVYPEGIPAILAEIQHHDIKPTDTCMCLDLGGTTSDACIFTGKLNNIINVDSYNCGMFEVMENIRAELNNDLNNIYTMHLDFILRNANNPELIKDTINKEIDVRKHYLPVFERLYRQVIELNKGSLSNTKVFLAGGGAFLFHEFLQEKDIESTVIQNAETALAESILLIHSKQSQL